MANNEYEVTFEVDGSTAMFTRPDTGSTPISYPVPTYSAARGMFEAVARVPHVFVRPIKVEICRPIRYDRFVTNYGGPLRKSSQVREDNNYQLIATVLVDVCYRLYAHLLAKRSTRGVERSASMRRRRGKDWLTLFKQRFEQRLADGQTFYTPCLGWKEFVPTYFGPFRPATRTQEDVNLVIPSLLHEMWDHKALRPTFRQDMHISEGVMWYEQSEERDAE